MDRIPHNIFFSGIGGSGVSALAAFMADKGYTVLGSDRIFDTNPADPRIASLKSKGIALTPHDGTGIDTGVDLVVFSTAVEQDHPEHLKAHELGIETMTRPQLLSAITNHYVTVAITGTSGKSTTAGLLSFIMKSIGMDPNFIGGGRVKQFKSLSSPGNALSGQSEYLIIEACESDGSIINYSPEYSLILNLSLDHNPIDKTGRMFEKFIRNTGKKVIMNADDKNLEQFLDKNTITFSIDNPSSYFPDSINYGLFSTAFSLRNIDFHLPLPGKHNLYNALACISILSEIGVPLSAIAGVLPEFRGLDRRFDIHLHTEKYLVIDDYAHNPHKIAYLMKTVSKLRDRICYIFQPHGYGPTRLMRDGYIRTFTEHLRENDHLILMPIYYTGGTVAKDISSDVLAGEIIASGRSVTVLTNRDEVRRYLDTYNSFIVLGARDESLSDFTGNIAESLRKKTHR